jgi:hypothetical protein
MTDGRDGLLVVESAAGAGLADFSRWDALTKMFGFVYANENGRGK